MAFQMFFLSCRRREKGEIIFNPYSMNAILSQKIFSMPKKKYRIVQGWIERKNLPIIFQQLLVRGIKENTDNATEFTKPQLVYHEKLQKAILYGKNVVADPDMKATYNSSLRPGLSAFNVAVADFLWAPHIRQVDVTNYTGRVGEKIIIEVTDNFKVVKVHVLIENSDGSKVEDGFGVKVSDHVWIYTTSVSNHRLDGDKITITAYDLPENTSGEVISL